MCYPPKDCKFNNISYEPEKLRGVSELRVGNAIHNEN